MKNIVAFMALAAIFILLWAYISALMDALCEVLL
jgi:hypothetical protein